MSKQRPDCPKCKNNKYVIPIEYGYPGPEMSKEASKGNIRLGGCCVDFTERSAESFRKASESVETGEKFNFIFELEDPGWYCKRHDLEF